MKHICVNSACQIFNLGESYTKKDAISFYASHHGNVVNDKVSEIVRV